MRATTDAFSIPAPAPPQDPESRNIPPCAGRKGWRERLGSFLRWSPPGMGGPVDLPLLAFLVLFLNVKVSVKIPVLALACLLQPGFVSVMLRARKVPAFYPLILLAAAVSWFFFQGIGNLRYDLVAGLAILTWICCWVAAAHMRLFADRVDPGTLHRTLCLFFLLNALVSLAQLISIDWEIKALNPYLYQGMYQKYFIRTGDFIKGITFDTSTTNALISAFGVVYFLARKQGWMMLCCMACMLATGSNFTNILLLGVFFFIYFFRSDRQQKGGIILCILMGAVFLGKVSPQNETYTQEVLSRWHFARVVQVPAKSVGRPAEAAIDANRQHAALSLLRQTPINESLKKKQVVFPQTTNASTHDVVISCADSERISYARAFLDSHPLRGSSWSPRPEVPVPDINSLPYQSRADTTAEQRALLAFIDAHKAGLPLATRDEVPKDAHVPGKLLALREIGSFYRQHPARIIFGDGPGNFSSKLAFRATGLGMSGGYPSTLTYIDQDFLHNHLDLYLAYFSKPKEVHSLVNSPDSVYAQMTGEYGLAGLVLVLIFYLGYFFKTTLVKTYALPLLLLLAGAFCIGYWFEQLSIVVLFELLVFADRRSFTQTATSA